MAMTFIRLIYIKGYYFFYALFTTNWRDICVDCPLENHAINVTGHDIELAPLGLILDVQDTLLLIIILCLAFIPFYHNFMKGYRGE
jgi:hypothetical protein